MIAFVLTGGILNFLLGVVVFFRGGKEEANRYFSLACFSTTALVLFDTLFRLRPSLLVLEFSFATAVVVSFLVLVWVSKFISSNWSTIKMFLISLPAIITIVLIFIDGMVVKSFTELLKFGYRGEYGPFFSLFSFTVSFYIIFSLYLLYQKIKVAEVILERQIKYIMFSIASYGFLGVIFSLILPKFFGIYDLTLLDAPSSGFFVILI